MFDIGLTTTPYLVRPFIAKKKNIFDEFQNENNTLEEGNVTKVNNEHDGELFYVPFAIYSSLTFLMAVFACILFFVDKSFVLTRSDKVDGNRVTGNNRKAIITYVLLLVILLLLSTIDLSLNQMSMPIAEKHLNWSVEEAIYFSSSPFIAKTVACLVVITISQIVNPGTILAVNAILIISGCVILPFVVYKSFLIWLSAALIGSGGATFYSTVLCWRDNKIQMTSFMAGIYGCTYCISTTVSIQFSSYLMEKIAFSCYLYFILSCGILLMILQITCFLIVRSNQTNNGNGEIEPLLNKSNSQN